MKKGAVMHVNFNKEDSIELAEGGAQNPENQAS